MSRDRGGFTFVELLVVVAIIGILASIALPKYSGTRDKAKVAGLRTDVRNAETAEETYYADNGSYASFAQLQADGLLTLSPGTTMVVAGSAVGYNVRATNSTIETGTNSCGVRVGAGAPIAVDGVISCP